MVSIVRALLCCSVFTLLGVSLGWAKEDPVVGDSDEAFAQVRRQQDAGSAGTDIEAVLDTYARGGVVDEGTYAPSELWEQKFDLRRVKPAELGVHGELFFKYSDDNESGLEKWEKELVLNLDYEDWSGYFRFSDVNVFPNVEDPIRWEKGRVRYRGDGITATVGSFGQVFGRGLAVNMYESRVLDFDNEVEGAKVDVDLGQGTSLTALWGTRKNRFDARNSEIGAAHLEVPLNPHLTLGATTAGIRFPEATYSSTNLKTLGYDIWGGDATFRSGQFSLFAEGVQVEHEKVEYGNYWDSQGSPGTGYYVNAIFAGRGYALSAEYKDYDGIQHPFSVLPPIRRFPDKATAAPNDDKGYGFHLNYSPFNDGSAFELSYVQDNEHNKGALYTEFSAIYTSSVSGSTNWVAEYWDVTNLGEKHVRNRLTVNHKLSEDWTATTFLERERVNLGYIDPYLDYIVEGEIAFQSKANLIYTWETTEKKDAAKTKWGLWELKLTPDEEQEFNVRFGSRREGIVCSGGLCRPEPAFDGFRVDYLLRF